MAVNDTPKEAATVGAWRRFLIGANVIFTVIAAVVVVAFLQWVAGRGGYIDMTSTSVNSLNEATGRLLENLDTQVRLVSLYFEADLEEKDQPRYRNTVDDLLALYESTNRSMIDSEWVNPLKDHEKRKKLIKRLGEIPRFKEQIDSYTAVVNTFDNEIKGEMVALVNAELETVFDLNAGLGAESAGAPLSEVQLVLENWQRQLGARAAEVDDYLGGEVPAYSAATATLRSLYGDFSKQFSRIAEFGQEMVRRGRSSSPAEEDFLAGAEERYRDLLSRIDEANEAVQELEPLKFDEVIAELTPTGNALLVETPEDAIVVGFADLWPPIDPNITRPTFKDRAFKGEEKLTTAILRATHKEQTAVVFVRYGGQPFFFGGFMPGQPAARLAQMKGLLEDTNFTVAEWDLKTSLAPPELDPKPTRTIYVVFKPTPPQDPFGRSSQEPPFADQHREALLDAMGENGRALFVAGWAPGPFGPIPSTYEYDDYLNSEWGVKVDTSALLLQFVNVGSDQFRFPRGGESMRDVVWADHDIVHGLRSLPVRLPLCAPLDLSGAAEGVTIERLTSLPQRAGLWGAKNILKYQEQLPNESIYKVEGDLEGPFDLAVAASKEEAKIVVVSSAGFAEDAVTMARDMVLSSAGLQLRSRNPGNVALFINSLHWLNDNTEFMNIGRPIDLAVLDVPGENTVRAVRAFSMVVWPVAAMAFGCAVWLVRRR